MLSHVYHKGTRSAIPMGMKYQKYHYQSSPDKESLSDKQYS